MDNRVPGEGPGVVPAVQLQGLTKRYGRSRGVEDITLDVGSGEILGFLGPNGAGKTTVLRSVMGFLRPTAGAARVLGLDAASESVAVRRQTGYLPGDPSLYNGRTGWDHLALCLRARGIAEAPMTQRLVEALGAPMERDVKKCSRGMRQKIALVLALSHDPEVLMLDEPTSGLDPLAQRALLQYLDERARAGRAVILSSHILSEVEQVCDRVAILREGRLTAVSTVEDLRAQKYREVTVSFDGDPPRLDEIGDTEVVWSHEGRMTFRVRGDAGRLLQVLAAAAITDVTITEPSLEEVFLDYYRPGGTV
jgi:ABC-2 type transport system ATP-binding protein